MKNKKDKSEWIGNVLIVIAVVIGVFIIFTAVTSSRTYVCATATVPEDSFESYDGLSCQGDKDNSWCCMSGRTMMYNPRNEYYVCCED